MSKALPTSYTGWLTVNRACNLRCHWCYAASVGHQKKDNMTLETARRAIEVFKGLPLRRVILIGGEPTIHPDFFKIVTALKEAGLGVTVVTNGIAFSDTEFLKETIERGVDGITTSLKATNADLYRARTGVHAFAFVMKAIQHIESKRSSSHSNLYHKLSYTVCEMALSDIEELIRCVSECGSPSLSLDMIRPSIGCGSSILAGPKPSELAMFFPAVYKLLEGSGIDYSIKVSIPFCLFPRGFTEELVRSNRIVSGCQLLQNGRGVIVDQQGRLLPCNHFCNHPIGSIEGDTPSGVTYVQLRKKQEVRDFYETLTGFPDRRCVECADWKYCGGGCRVHWLHHSADELIASDQSQGRGGS